MNAIQSTLENTATKDSIASQKEIPLLEGLLAHVERGASRFHVPGHKGGNGAPAPFMEAIGSAAFLFDLTELDPIDHLQKPHGIIARAQTLAADAFAAEQTFFLVNGSTSGVISMLLSALGDGSDVILSRSSHRSAYGGLILSGAIPHYIGAPYNTEMGITCPITPGLLQQALHDYANAKAVLVTSPNYYGLAADSRNLANLVHAHGLPFLQDEAHGAHFNFHPRFETSAMRAGADMAVQSAHKTLGSLTQSSLLHWHSGHIPLERLRSVLRMIQSTSPSYLLTASLDATRWQMANFGQELWEQAINLAEEARCEINLMPPLRCFGEEVLSSCGAHSLDPTKLTIHFRELGISGYQALDLLRQHGVEVEMGDPWNILAIVTMGDTEESISSLLDALRSIVAEVDGTPVKCKCPPLGMPPIPRQLLSPRQAFYASSCRIPLREAVGRACAETITPYPPGVPIICPGEEIDEAIIDYTLQLQDYGADIHGAENESLEWIRVIQ
jgi:arginine decarboxylase